MPNRIAIVIVDDHPALRMGLAAMVSVHEGFEVVAEVEDRATAIAACEKHHPDVVLMDLRINGSGVDATLAIRQRWPKTRVLVITTFDSDEDIHRAIEAGASGYLLKGLSTSELIDAILKVHDGKTVMPPNVASRLKERNLRKDLSPREMQALQLIAAGQSNKEIASQLEIGPESVKTHLKSLFLKLGVADRTQAVIVALRQGIIQI